MDAALGLCLVIAFRLGQILTRRPPGHVPPLLIPEAVSNVLPPRDIETAPVRVYRGWYTVECLECGSLLLAHCILTSISIRTQLWCLPEPATDRSISASRTFRNSAFKLVYNQP